MDKDTVKTIDGLQSLSECRESILQVATRISKDISSTFINDARIVSLRVLIDLFEMYNKQIKKFEEDERLRSFGIKSTK